MSFKNSYLYFINILVWRTNLYTFKMYAITNGNINVFFVLAIRGYIMENLKTGKSIKIVDAVEYNGRYIEASSMRKKIIIGGAMVVLVALIICIPILFV